MTGAVAFAPAPPPSPGTYLRLRRQAADLTLAGVARATVSSPVDVDAVIEALAAAEADRELLGDADLARLRLAFRFDPRVYAALIDGAAVDVCAGCGCSWDDPCDEGGRGCAWADAAAALCTACGRPPA